jgi:transposase
MVRKSELRRQHTPAFKWEAVQVLHKRRAAGVSLQRVSDELDVGVGLLRRWAQAVAGAPAGASVDDIFPGSGRPREFPEAPLARPAVPPESPEAELRRLRRENERLRMERDFLKKAAAFFAKESR